MVEYCRARIKILDKFFIIFSGRVHKTLPMDCGHWFSTTNVIMIMQY